MKRFITAVCIVTWVLVCVQAYAQISLGVEVGFTMPTDQYHLPEHRQNYPLFIDPRPGIYTTGVVQQDWERVSLYAQAGFMMYRTYDGIGPFLSPTGVGFQAPSYGQAVLWRGTVLEIGIRKTVYQHWLANVEVGLGVGHSYEVYSHDNVFPCTKQGFVSIPGSLYFEQEMTWLSPHSFVITPQIRIWRPGRNGHRWWLKATYAQGLNKKAEGVYDIYLVDLDDTRTYDFSFDVVLRHSFYNLTLGYELFTSRPEFEPVTK